LHAGPAEAVERQAGVFKLAAHGVVGDFFAAVLEQERGADIGVRGVAAVGAEQELIHRLAAKAAAFAVREREEARKSERGREALGVHALGGEPRDLRRAHARGQREADTIRRGAPDLLRTVEPVVPNRAFPAPSISRATAARPAPDGRGSRPVGWHRSAASCARAKLRVAGEFAAGFLAGGGGEQEFKRVGGDGSPSARRRGSGRR